MAETATLRLFGPARELAGIGTTPVDGATVGAVLDGAIATWGPPFGELLSRCQVWVNGESAGRETTLVAGDEVAVIPPVSGGSF